MCSAVRCSTPLLTSLLLAQVLRSLLSSISLLMFALMTRNDDLLHRFEDMDSDEENLKEMPSRLRRTYNSTLGTLYIFFIPFTR